MRLSEIGLTLADIDLGSIDAEADHNLAAYFITTPYVQSAFSGKRTLFLGRKGSGKSALFTQLSRLFAESDLAEVALLTLTPDQYAWSALRDYKEQGILPEQAHTNAWKLTLAIEVAAKLVGLSRDWMGPAETNVATLRKFLDANFGNTQPGLTKTAASVLKGLRQFNFSAFGFGVGMQRVGDDPQPMTPTVVSSLFDTLAPIITDQRVVIALDRLDDSWDGSEEAQSLMIGLLKASKELNDRFDGLTDGGLRVLVFLRSDIYDSLGFDDKDKHRPTEQHIAWTARQLKEMLGKRLPDDTSVDELFEPGDMRGGTAPFTYIAKRTFLRPREIIQYADECIRVAGAEATEISKEDIRTAEDRYSRWKVDDLKQEYSKVAPALDPLLECLRQQVNRYDSLRDLEALIDSKAHVLVERYGRRALLELLFDSSVIGVRLGNSGSPKFKSEDSELVLPTTGAVYVHQSLTRGLKIRETRAKAEPEGKEEEGTLQDRVTIELWSTMTPYNAIQDVMFLGARPTPLDVLLKTDFVDFARALGITIQVLDDASATTPLARPNVMSRTRFLIDQNQYATIRGLLMGALTSYGLTVAEYEAGERAANRHHD